MGLDPKYVLAPSLQEFFIDKDSGLPMSGGQVYFFEDDARSMPKPVYEISGTPPNYSYTVLPNPVTLSAVGTFQDGSGNDIVPYYYPYDINGDVELYYIEVYDSDGVLQFTREGWPNTTANENTDQDVTNFIPNGQFLLHNDIPAVAANSYNAGQVYQDTTILGQGGWTFERTNSSAATDIVTFPEYGSIEIPTGNPRYACKIQTTVANPSDTRKDLCIKFPGVNTFASTSQPYNFYFEAQTLSGGTVPIEIVLRKFYGTGGSPTATSETIITTQDLLATINSFNTEIDFGINTSSVLGTNNDDYVQICIRLPTDSTQTVLFTDFALTFGSEERINFPNQSEAEQLAPSTAGWLPTPNPDGSDLYLPIVLTQIGCTFDHSEIGSIVAKPNTTAVNNELLCDGSQYITGEYSSLGIPYSRLQAKIFNTTYNAPLFGTGLNFVNAYQCTGANANQFVLILNKRNSSQTDPADGVTATGFNFGVTNRKNATSTSHGYVGFSNSAASISFQSNFQTPTTGGNAFDGGTSGMGPSNYTDPRYSGPYYLVEMTALSAAALSAGSGNPGLYFTFSNASTNFYMWFQVAGETDPAPGGTGIECFLTSTMTAADVSAIISAVITGYQTNAVTCTSAATIPDQSYFTIHANSQLYAVWYQVNSSSSKPVVGGSPIYIQVTLTGGETAAQVCSKTIAAINGYSFAVPDLRGVFLRGNDPTSIWDLDTVIRYARFPGMSGLLAGTFEIFQTTTHAHGVPTINATTNLSTGPSSVTGTFNAPNGRINSDPTYGTETRPVNFAVNYYIKY